MSQLESEESLLQAAVETVRQHWDVQPRLGIILGTGSGGVADRLEIEASIPYHEIPGFVKSTATGHKGKVILGKLGSLPVVAMQGRFHRYEGWSFSQMVFPTKLMIQLGIEGMVVTNAAGGVDPRMNVGDLILIDSHIDLLSYWPGSEGFHARETFEDKVSGTTAALPNDRPTVRGDAAYDETWLQLAQQVADENQIRCRPGTYVGLHGPNYETRAEYRMMRRIGADVVGMSTVPEVSIASLHRLPVLAISVVTNVARPDALSETSGEEVVHAAKNVEGMLRTIIEESSQRRFP